MKDLYKILGVKKNAGANVIKKVYRKRAAQTHPDKGGDREEFEELVFSYRILSNPALKEKYDKGELVDDDLKPDPTELAKISLIMSAFNGAVEEILEKEALPSNLDIFQHLIQFFKTRAQHIVAQKNKTTRKISLAKDLMQTIHPVEEDELLEVNNPFLAALRSKIQTMEHIVKQIEHDLEMNAGAIEELRRYRCDMEAFKIIIWNRPPPQISISTAMGSLFR